MIEIHEKEIDKLACFYTTKENYFQAVKYISESFRLRTVNVHEFKVAVDYQT